MEDKTVTYKLKAEDYGTAMELASLDSRPSVDEFAKARFVEYVRAYRAAQQQAKNQ